MTTSRSKKLEELCEQVTRDTDDSVSLELDDIERAYIGGSSIGHPCERNVAMRLRGFPKDKRSDRENRILAMGQLIERLLVAELRAAAAKIPGVEIDKTSSMFSEQAEAKYFGNVCRAYGDGIITIDGEQILLELKSANSSSFNTTKRVGVRYAHEEYYSQINIIMGELEIEQTLFIMMNKDTSELHIEVVDYNEIEHHFLRARVEYIAGGADERIMSSPANYICKMCDYSKACWFDAPIPKDYKHCKHCKHSYFDGDPNVMVKCSHHLKSALPHIKAGADYLESCKRAQSCVDFKDRRED